MPYQDNALPNTLTIGDPAAPTLVLHNRGADGNGDGIVQIGGVFGVDVVGDTLSIDEVDATIQYGRAPDVGMTVYEVYLSPSGEVYVGPDDAIYSRLLASVPDGTRGALVDVRTLPYGTPVKWECDARTIAAFYLKSIHRVGKTLYRLVATSGVGLLDNDMHLGGLYNGETFAAVAADIIGGRFPVTVVDALAGQAVYGWLPYDTRRNNLHQLLFAFGAALRRTPAGEAQIAFLSASSPQPVPDDRVTFGGDVSYEDQATRVEITEHSFFQTAEDEEITLFDNTDDNTPASHTPVYFSAGGPVYGLTTTGTLSIDNDGTAFGVNYAIITGRGTLSGKLYSHNTRIVSESVPGTPIQPIVRDVTDYTLINYRNSLNVALRVFEYYQSARTISASMAVDGERCGDILSLTDPFLEPMTAFLESISVNASTNLWGPARLIEGYTPRHHGNGATGSTTLTGSGTWTSPFTGTLQYVLISGGQGGQAGSDGQDAQPFVIASSTGTLPNRSKWYAKKEAVIGIASGGAAGNPGAGGRQKSGYIEVTQGQTISFACGLGGAGGVRGVNGGLGALGADTTFGADSTVNGESIDAGFLDPITGNVYGMRGARGYPGGDGGGVWNGARVEPETRVDPEGRFWHGGANGAQKHEAFDETYFLGREFWYLALGGFGGGAAYGANGGDGEDGDGYISTTPIGDWLTCDKISATPGRGGNGANALPPDAATIPGAGGAAGNGGGGAGAYGSGPRPLYQTTGANTYTICEGPSLVEEAEQEIVATPTGSGYGKGGLGSNGGDGADGIIILYWGD